MSSEDTPESEVGRSKNFANKSAEYLRLASGSATSFFRLYQDASVY